MFSELLERVKNHYKNGLPFVIYRKPKEELVHAILQEDKHLHYTFEFTETGFVFSPFDSSEKSVLIPFNIKFSEHYQTNRDLVSGKSANDLADTSQEEFHLDVVKKGIKLIKEKALKKVVISRKISAKCSLEPLELFQNLLDNYNTAFCYLWYHPKVGTWLGATPEILLKTENQQLTTMSLAGTQNYVENQIPEWGKKELEEQQLVTDYISDSLKDTVSNLSISTRESIRAGQLWHLRTKLTGRIENGNLQSCIAALHPTPAVCGMPMAVAKSFILENENYNREFYTGFLGELNFKEERERSSNSRNQENKAYRSVKNKTILFVNLRCMKLKGGYAEIYVGGGITQDSDPEKEWHETVSKSNTMLRIINSK